MAASSARLLAAAARGRAATTFRHAPTVSSSLSFPPNPHHRPSLRGRAGISFSSTSISLPSGSPHGASAPFNLFPPDSDPFIQWDPPPPDAASPLGAGAAGREAPGDLTLVVLLGWLGARQKHLRRYADLYRDRGVGSVRFVVPVRELLGLDLGRRVERRVADLAAEIAAWCDADHRRTLLFHTFSNTGWLAYGNKTFIFRYLLASPNNVLLLFFPEHRMVEIEVFQTGQEVDRLELLHAHGLHMRLHGLN